MHLSVSRENVEMTFKEVTLRIMQLVLEDTHVHVALNCQELGTLHIHTKPLQFKLKKNVALVVLPQVIKVELPAVEAEVKQISKECGIIVSKLLDVKLPEQKAVTFEEKDESSAYNTRPRSNDSEASDLTIEGSDEWPRFVIRSCKYHEYSI